MQLIFTARLQPIPREGREEGLFRLTQSLNQRLEKSRHLLDSGLVGNLESAVNVIATRAVRFRQGPDSPRPPHLEYTVVVQLD
jgi:hypothetical protein